jgi:hypothetical protein
MARYSKAAAAKVERAMKERKQGRPRSGRSGKKLTGRKQAIAIGLSEARREGKRVPPGPVGRPSKTARSRAAKKAARTRQRRAR